MAQFAALLLAESSWLFLLGAGLGLALPGKAPLLPWPGVLALLTLALVGARWAARTGMSPLRSSLLGVALAIASIYGLLAWHAGGALWALRLATLGAPGLEIARIWLAVALSLGVWWLGLRMAGTLDLADSLSLTFRIGLAVLAVAGIIEVTTRSSLGARLVAFPFFGASLAGLALSRLATGDKARGGGAPWARTLAVVVSWVLLVGFGLSFLAGGPLSSATVALLRMLGKALDVAFAVLLLPIEFVLGYIFRGLSWLVRWLSGGREAPPLQLPDFSSLFQRPEETQAQAGGALATLGLALKWTIVALLALGLLYFLARIFRVRLRAGQPSDLEVRESVEGESDPREDLGALLGNLLPRFPWRSGKTLVYPLPPGDDLRARLYRAYFRLLNAAAQRGRPREVWQTPLEYQPSLQAQFPTLAAGTLTEAFNRARFGHTDPRREGVERLESEAEGAIGKG